MAGQTAADAPGSFGIAGGCDDSASVVSETNLELFARMDMVSTISVAPECLKALVTASFTARKDCAVRR